MDNKAFSRRCRVLSIGRLFLTWRLEVFLCC
jgi:hypothetical protein